MTEDILYCKNMHEINIDNDRGVKYNILSLRCKICFYNTRSKYRKSNKGKEKDLRYYLSNKGKDATKRSNHSELSDDRYLKYRLKKLYNLTIEEYNFLVIQQCNLCLICGNILTKKIRCCIDHDHITGKVRGLLCNNCNQAIGILNEDIKSLNNMIVYLNDNK